ncbi:hypothetical protein FQR65_LT13498 [Abscondita terminalis]|nr:hypothetical protein FQR65_LT13498 [Abscondita terminalis]
MKFSILILIVIFTHTLANFQEADFSLSGFEDQLKILLPCIETAIKDIDENVLKPKLDALLEFSKELGVCFNIDISNGVEDAIMKFLKCLTENLASASPTAIIKILGTLPSMFQSITQFGMCALGISSN